MNISKIYFQIVLLFFVALISCRLTNGADKKDAFDPSKIAAIKILPYRDSPSAPPAATAAPSAVISVLPTISAPAFDKDRMFGRQYTSSKGASNEFNLGKTFTYLSLAEYKEQDSEGQMLNLMRQIFDYHHTLNAKEADKKSDKKNVLLVRMRIKATTGSSVEEAFEYVLGVYVSGAPDEDRCGEIRNLTTVHKEFPDPIKKGLECQGFCDLWNANKNHIRDHLREYSLIDEAIPDSLTLDQADKLLTIPVFKSSHIFWRFGPVKKKLIPIANSGNIDEIGDAVLTRLGFELDKTGKKKPKYKTERERYEAEIRGSQEAMRRSDLTYKLFGKPCYTEINDDKHCFGKDSACGIYFNQSEQGFLCWLEQAGYFGNDVNNSPNCYAQKPFIRGQKYNVSKVEIDLLSFLDICRFCRGTMSYMLSSGKMNDILSTFFKHLKKDDTDVGGVTFMLGYETKITAFSYEKTDI